MEESFFPILWRRDGYRSPFLEDYVSRGSAAALEAPPAWRWRILLASPVS
jgi:hypothetical protein